MKKAMNIKKKQNRLPLLDDYIQKSIRLCHLEIRLNFQLHPTEPENFTPDYISPLEEEVKKVNQ